MKDPKKQRAATASNAVRGARSLARFKDRLDELGATLVEADWLGARTPHRVICAEGHDCAPMPNNVISGFGVCKVCAGTSPAASRQRFLDRLDELGATLLDPWKGRHTNHRVRCSEGHECNPRPGNVIQGGGVCRQCAWQWNAFYIVTDGTTLKFGITTGDPRPRVNVHARAGLTEQVLVADDLPEGAALGLENELKRMLAAAGVAPVRGVEYFPASVRRMVVAVAEEWLDLRR